MLCMLLGAAAATSEQEDPRIIPLKRAQGADLSVLIGELIIGELRSANDVGPHSGHLAPGRPHCGQKAYRVAHGVQISAEPRDPHGT